MVSIKKAHARIHSAHLLLLALVLFFFPICSLYWLRGYDLFPVSGACVCVRWLGCCFCCHIPVPFSFCLFRHTSGFRFPFSTVKHTPTATRSILTASVGERVGRTLNYSKLIEQQTAKQRKTESDRERESKLKLQRGLVQLIRCVLNDFRMLRWMGNGTASVYTKGITTTIIVIINIKPLNSSSIHNAFPVINKWYLNLFDSSAMVIFLLKLLPTPPTHFRFAMIGDGGAETKIEKKK